MLRVSRMTPASGSSASAESERIGDGFGGVVAHRLDLPLGRQLLTSRDHVAKIAEHRILITGVSRPGGIGAAMNEDDRARRYPDATAANGVNIAKYARAQTISVFALRDGDLSDSDEPARLVDQAVDAHGPISEGGRFVPDPAHAGPRRSHLLPAMSRKTTTRPYGSVRGSPTNSTPALAIRWYSASKSSTRRKNPTRPAT